jgi:hypothetical protein
MIERVREQTISLTVNGVEHRVKTHPMKRLLDILRLTRELSRPSRAWPAPANFMQCSKPFTKWEERNAVSALPG